jgi:hypothetical protein
LQTFGEDELSRSHPTFTWVFKASRNWAALKDMIPGMAENLSSNPAAKKYTPGHSMPASKDDASEISANFGMIFRQLFCVAAQRLACTIHEPLEKVGVLFEEPLETGALHLSGSTKVGNSVPKLAFSSKQGDVERDGANASSFGRGKYLFLNRQLDKAEVENFAAMGYRFGSIEQISERLAAAMEVPNHRMRTRLDRMKLFASVEHLPPPGVHLACFMLRPSVSKSFDVLVPTKSQNQLPLTTMQPEPLNEWQSTLLNRFDEWSVKEILTTLINEAACLELERAFRWQVHSSLIHLLELVGDFDSLMNAKFCAKHIEIPCRINMGTSDTSSCTLLVIRLMNTLHSKPQKDDLTYMPLSFFSAQQQVDSLHPNHEAFARRVKLEFGHPPPRMTDPTIPTNSTRSSRTPSLTDIRHLRLHDSNPSSPTSLTRFKNKLKPLTGRKSEESSIVHVRDLSEEKNIPERDEVDEVSIPTPTLTFSTEYHSDSARNSAQEVRATGHDRIPPLSPSSLGKKVDNIELVALTSNDSAGGWVSDLFALFGLGNGLKS